MSTPLALSLLSGVFKGELTVEDLCIKTKHICCLMFVSRLSDPTLKMYTLISRFLCHVIPLKFAFSGAFILNHKQFWEHRVRLPGAIGGKGGETSLPILGFEPTTFKLQPKDTKPQANTSNLKDESLKLNNEWHNILFYNSQGHHASHHSFNNQLDDYISYIYMIIKKNCESALKRVIEVKYKTNIIRLYNKPEIRHGHNIRSDNPKRLVDNSHFQYSQYCRTCRTYKNWVCFGAGMQR